MRAALFDLDGTLADTRHRRSYLPVEPQGPADWVDYHARCRQDAPIPGPIALARLLAAHHRIVVVSARPNVPLVRRRTEGWLARHDVPFDELHLQPLDAPSVQEWKASVVAAVGPVALAVDDWWQNVDALVAAGVPVLHVTPPGIGRPRVEVPA